MQTVQRFGGLKDVGCRCSLKVAQRPADLDVTSSSERRSADMIAMQNCSRMRQIDLTFDRSDVAVGKEVSLSRTKEEVFKLDI